MTLNLPAQARRTGTGIFADGKQKLTFQKASMASVWDAGLLCDHAVVLGKAFKDKYCWQHCLRQILQSGPREIDRGNETDTLDLPPDIQIGPSARSASFFTGQALELCLYFTEYHFYFDKVHAIIVVGTTDCPHHLRFWSDTSKHATVQISGVW